ncbi:hypothetical protein E2P42_02305 [Candidatus Bathyarchaeota archaeon]|nr:hypothetical protein E2P42_02305 [Candidatus Bathyarchaeota archaeon]
MRLTKEESAIVETVRKLSLNRSAKEHRHTLFRVLDAFFKHFSQKIRTGRNSDRVKQGWARVLVSAVSTYAGLLKDEELEQSPPIRRNREIHS